MVENQISNLIFDPSFDHNLCFKYSNGMCKPILDMYVPITFQWYNEIFNPMSFVPCNHSLNIRKSIGIPTPKVGAHMGMCGFIPSQLPTLSRTWNVILRLHFQPAPLQAFTLVVSQRLGLQHKMYILSRSIR